MSNSNKDKVKRILDDADKAGIPDILPKPKHRPLRALRDYLVLKAPEPEAVTAGGIAIPEEHRETMMRYRQQGMRVVGIGPDVQNKSFQIGDEVLICTAQERHADGSIVAHLV